MTVRHGDHDVREGESIKAQNALCHPAITAVTPLCGLEIDGDLPAKLIGLVLLPIPGTLSQAPLEGSA